ncbi:MAG: cytochrome c oxidase subunit II [Deltaproteobacteria bacterium CG11_big_fil_rev_8_21_14_0_20_47_16]|nr:MAG: cytochrome c oxidase subunit II [Deltaproteobacteria bacterium CG11_big_fil_rev_8_21_14_0_20_47_16]
MLGLLLSWSKPNLPAVSSFATNVDTIYAFIFWVSVICFIAIVGTMTYFVFKYRRKSENDKTPYIEGHTPTEVGISIGLFVLVMGLFYWGWVEYMHSRTSPMNPYEINVVGQQWSWNFQYANGKRTQRNIHIPVNTPIRLIMTSSDVLHSFYVPALRLKQDVVPGTYQYLAFSANTPGEYDIFCAEFCGLDHSAMLGKLVVMEAEEFADWQDDMGKYAKTAAAGGTQASGKSLIEQGRDLYSSKTCSACHSDDGTPRVGPSFKDLFGKTEELTDGATITVDETYIRDSIVDPNKQVVKGFVAGTMPTFKGQLNDDELNALVAFIKSLSK